jgi:hypothetical protein
MCRVRPHSEVFTTIYSIMFAGMMVGNMHFEPNVSAAKNSAANFSIFWMLMMRIDSLPIYSLKHSSIINTITAPTNSNSLSEAEQFLMNSILPENSLENSNFTSPHLYSPFILRPKLIKFGVITIILLMKLNDYR